MASTTPSVTPRLRMTRYGPSASITATYDKSTQSASLSEAGPSRLPEFSQLVDVDIDVSSDNMYASDVPTEHQGLQARSATSTPRLNGGGGTLPMSTTPATVTRSDKDKTTPADRLRALLSRVPTRQDGEDDADTPTRNNTVPNSNDDSRYPSEKNSDYDMDAASVAHSVAQSSLNNIFQRALREPGDTPRKDRSVTIGRGRSNSFGVGGVMDSPSVVESMLLSDRRSFVANEVMDSPSVVESMLLSNRKSMSDDEFENMRSAQRTNTRSHGPRTLTREFLRERFGSSSTSPTKPHPASNGPMQELSIPDLNLSQGTAPAATSTPQQSLWMSYGGDSKFQSNLLDQDSEMHNDIQALGGSTTDTESERSVSPPPTLRIQAEEDQGMHEQPAYPQDWQSNEAANQSHPTRTGLASGSDMSITMQQNGFGGDHETLGEESMSISLPAGHHRLQVDRSRSSSNLRAGSMTPLAHRKSISTLRPISPMPGHRPASPMMVDDIHERERNWNKFTPAKAHSHSQSHSGLTPHLSRQDSNSSLRSMAVSPTSSLHRDRERADSRMSISNIQSPPLLISPKRDRHSSFHSHSRSPSHASASYTPSRTPPAPIHPRSRTTSLNSNSSDQSASSISSFSHHHRRPSTPSDAPPEIIHERERNWNAPHPKWHDGPSLHAHRERTLSTTPEPRSRANSFQNGTPPSHVHHSHSHSRTESPSYTPQSTRAVSPQLNRRSVLGSTTPLGTPGVSRIRSPLPTPPSRSSSLKSIGNTYQSHAPSTKRHLTSPSINNNKNEAGQVDVGSSASTNGASTSNLRSPATKRMGASSSAKSKIPVPHELAKSRSGRFLGEKDVVESPQAERPVPVVFLTDEENLKAPSPYAWPSMNDEVGVEQNQRVSGTAGGHRTEAETDDLHDTDFSQSENEEEVDSGHGDDTPRTKLVEPPADSQDELPRQTVTSPMRYSSSNEQASPLPPANFDESQENGIAATDESMSPSSARPSTPPRQATPRLSKIEFATPSPPRNLPDLPTPSSSDESDRTSPIRKPRTPRFGSGRSGPNATPFNAKWAQTPKPPGGWLATPAPPTPVVLVKEKEQKEIPVERPSTSEDADRTPTDVSDVFPHTPNVAPGDFTLGKTPKAPGGWLATPAPPKVAGAAELSSEDDGQKGQLLTPVNSMSRASALNPKTPALPGGWAATPGPSTTRRSVLSVRFDNEAKGQDTGELTTESEELDGQESRKKARTETQVQIVAEPALPPSPRSPRKNKSSIRVLDAFGREQNDGGSPPQAQDLTLNKSMFRVLDALGREVKEEDLEWVGPETSQIEVAQDDAHLSKDELLRKMKKGLEELVDDIAELDKDHHLSPDKRARIRDLVATSRQARTDRKELQRQASISNRFSKPSIIQWGPRTILFLFVLQVVVFVLLHRISLVRARAQYMYSYYDPFNPELYGYIFNSDPSLNVDRFGSATPMPSSAATPQGDWKQSLRLLHGLFGYLARFWNADVHRRQLLAPT